MKLYNNHPCGRSALLWVCATLFALLAPFASTMAQDNIVILPAREVTVHTAFGEVENQTPIKIAVNWDYLDSDRKVLFAASSLTAKEILTQALAGTDNTWQFTGSRIIVTARDKTKTEPMPYSVMQRNSLPQKMTVVHDTWATREVTPEQIEKIDNGFWCNADGEGADSLGLAILNFRVNRASLERDYMDNAQTLDLIHKTFSDKELLSAMDFITVTAAASPEGKMDANAKLAADRAMAVKSYIMWKYPFMDRNRIFTFSIGEDWSGLYKMVVDDPHTPCRERVMEIIDSETSGDTKRAELKALGGAAWRYISANMLPRLRGAAACMIYYKEEPKPIHTHSVDTVYVEKFVEVPTIVEVEKDPMSAITETTAGRNGRYYMAVKTNLLYDALLLPDLALEFSLPRRWSIEVGGQWSWWQTQNKKYYSHRIQFAGLEVRKWLGKRDRTPLTGHFFGLYGMGGNYDLKLGEKGQLCNDMSWSVGLTYGYSMPIRQRLNLEFSLGVGYLWGEYDTYKWYDPHQCYNWQATYKRNYIGPTKAEVTLVWLIGSGKNPKKLK